MTRTAILLTAILLTAVSSRASAQETRKPEKERTDSSEVVMNLSLDEVVVVGTGTEHKLKNAPVLTEVISGRKIAELNAGSLEDILSALSPSFDFSQSDMGSNMQLGGLGNSYILVLIDGKRMHGDLGGQNNLGMIDPSRIERIEIIKGAASALYGSDAIAGVINIILKKNREQVLVENTTRIGSYLDALQSNRLQLKIGKVTSTTDFQLKHTDGWQNTTCENPNRYEKPVTNSINKTVNEFTDWQIGEHIDWDINRKTAIYAEGGWYTKNIIRPCGVPDYKTYDFIYRDINAATGGKFKYKEKNYLTWDVMYNSHAYLYEYTFETWVPEPDEDGHTPSLFEPGDIALQSRQERVIAQARNVLYLPYRNTFSAGIEARYDGLKSPNRLDEEFVSDYTLSAYAQDEWNPIENLNITAGVRLTYNGTFGVHVSPKISAMYRLHHFRFRASYSEGFKTPTLKELHYRYIRQMSFVTLNLGNIDLKPQTSRYVSAGVEFTNSFLSISASGYYNRLHNMITLVTIPRSEAPADLIVTYDPARVRKYKNMDEATTAGLDVTAKWSPASWLTVAAGYSYLFTDAYLYDDEDECMKKVIIDGTANHRGTVSAVWNHQWARNDYRLAIGVFGRLQSERYYQEDGNGKGYNLWKINTSHRFTLGPKWKFEVNAGIDNVFDYFETTYHGLHYGTTTPGRTYYVSLNVIFGQKEGGKTKR